MNRKMLRRNDNFIFNGDFLESLTPSWTISDRTKVVRSTGLWHDEKVWFMEAVNEGEGSQEIILAVLPRPTPERAVYRLSFMYEVYGGKNAKVRIKPSLSDTVEIPLVSSRAERGQPPAPDVLLDLHLVLFSEEIALDPKEDKVTVTFVSASKFPEDWGGTRIAFVAVQLELEPLELHTITIDGEPMPASEPLRLCAGANGVNAHAITFNAAANSVWRETRASLQVSNGNDDPTDMLRALPPWDSEQLIESNWKISCAPLEMDTDIPHNLSLLSQYTAERYEIPAVSGHFRLDVIAVEEVAFYPVIDLAQSVTLCVRVESHYMKLPLANREVIWTLKDGLVDVEVGRSFSDAEGETCLEWTPTMAGNWELTASVDSYYSKQDARFVFPVRALQSDPWLGATFKLDDWADDPVWGEETGYPCRGATHKVTVTFPAGHPLDGTDLALHWSGDDTPEGLGVGIAPALESLNPLEGSGLTWYMACENRRDSQFNLSVRCSKLLETSPLQVMALAHNWLAIVDSRQSTKFPVVKGFPVRLAIQIRSEVPDVGTLPDIEVKWHVELEEVTLSTGEDGWSEFQFSPDQEGDFSTEAKVSSPYDRNELVKRFTLKVLGENPWQQLAIVTLADRPPLPIGLVCFRDNEEAELRVVSIDDALVDEGIWLSIEGDEGADLALVSDPPLEEARTMPVDGLTWRLKSNALASARFTLSIHHKELSTLELAGLLLSRALEGEGTLQLDGQELAISSSIYPCLGAEHTLKFIPKSFSPLTGLHLSAKNTGEALGMKLTPEAARDLISAGLQWDLDCRTSPAPGATALALDLGQLPLEYPLRPLLLGHNRIEIVDVREATFDPQVGESVLLELKVQSFYTKRPVKDVRVSFQYGDIAEEQPTEETGWARFRFFPTESGDAQVIAKVPSIYDGPDAFPTHTFNVKVLPVRPGSTQIAQEGAPMLDHQDSTRDQFVITKVREASFDPQVGETVWLGLEARTSGVRVAASGITVHFRVGEQQVSVLTNSEGWADFAYKAEHASDVKVTATLELEGAGGQMGPSHTFDVTTLAAGVWDAAQIGLNSSLPEQWGVQVLFPRTSRTETVKLSVDASSPLLGRDISLGLNGYSKPSELGVTLTPALGVARPLTAAGLSWTLKGTPGGACTLFLNASRILKRSPYNPVSLGATAIPALGNGGERPVEPSDGGPTAV
ncbi:hypothetical protein ACYZTR_07030 [Pseudomonas sp. Hz4]